MNFYHIKKLLLKKYKNNYVNKAQIQSKNIIVNILCAILLCFLCLYFCDVMMKNIIAVENILIVMKYSVVLTNILMLKNMVNIKYHKNDKHKCLCLEKNNLWIILFKKTAEMRLSVNLQGKKELKEKDFKNTCLKSKLAKVILAWINKECLLNNEKNGQSIHQLYSWFFIFICLLHIIILFVLMYFCPSVLYLYMYLTKPAVNTFVNNCHSFRRDSPMLFLDHLAILRYCFGIKIIPHFCMIEIFKLMTMLHLPCHLINTIFHCRNILCRQNLNLQLILCSLVKNFRCKFLNLCHKLSVVSFIGISLSLLNNTVRMVNFTLSIRKLHQVDFSNFIFPVCNISPIINNTLIFFEKSQTFNTFEKDIEHKQYRYFDTLFFDCVSRGRARTRSRSMLKVQNQGPINVNTSSWMDAYNNMNERCIVLIELFCCLKFVEGDMCKCEVLFVCKSNYLLCIPNINGIKELYKFR